MAKKNTTILKQIFNDDGIDEFINVFPNKVGSKGFDAWGFNLRSLKDSLRVIKFLYEDYFRVEAFGLENIPKEGRCLIIANHSGQLPIDGLLIAYAMVSNTHGARAPKAMAEKFFPTVPFVGNWLNSVGAVVGDTTNCERMLNNEEAIVVFPEGVRGSGKLFSKRYQLARFGNGFMHLAMKNKAPIIPVGVVGCEESIISLTDMKPLAKLLGIPYAPLVVPFVIPSKVYLHFGEPMYFENDVHSEHLITKRVDTVKAAINNLIKDGLDKRTSIFQK
ncbi:MAG: acyltransferase family protein [Chitinophagales bacterium]|nr:acyltransferase family protein [Chitinophagales bacterium]